MFVAYCRDTEDLSNGVILVIPHSLARSPVFGRGVKYGCVLRAESIIEFAHSGIVCGASDLEGS